MANLSKERRDRMIEKLEELKQQHNDDASIAALNEIENALREKKYGLVWEEHSEAVDDMLRENIPVLVEDPERRLCKDENLPWNFIIEGDNLQALYLLEKTHRGKVDCIYIDPPYNSGATDWKYNNDYVDREDKYRHSKWLSMMKSRLIVAKRLLNPHDSVLICTIDQNEFLHLGCLLEEVFSDARTIQMISTVINSSGSDRKDEFSRTNEFIFFVMMGKAQPVPMSLPDEWNGNVKVDKSKYGLYWNQLMRSGSSPLRINHPLTFYPIFVAEDGKSIVKVGEPLPLGEDRNKISPIEGTRVIWPIRSNGDEGRWQIGKERLEDAYKKGYVKLGGFTKNGMAITYLARGEQQKIEEGKINIIGHREDGSVIEDVESYEHQFIPSTSWDIPSHNATYFGSQLINKIFCSTRFSFPKSLYAVHDTIRFFIQNKPSAVVVDFFAGSGTTMHAVSLLNKEDGGKRTCICVTNNEVSEAEAKDLSKRGIVQGDKEWEAIGIAKYVTWPRIACSIQGIDINGEPLKGNYIGSDIPMADGFQTNVKYMKCDWIPRKPEEYPLSNALCLYVKELIELQTAQEVDGVKNVLILNKSDYRQIFEDEAAMAAVEHVWVNENLIFNAIEMKKMRSKRFRYIPREFFVQELKEVGEYV